LGRGNANVHIVEAQTNKWDEEKMKLAHEVGDVLAKMTGQTMVDFPHSEPWRKRLFCPVIMRPFYAARLTWNRYNWPFWVGKTPPG